MTSPSLTHETRHSKPGSGTTQRDGMGREREGLLGRRETWTPMADACQHVAKTTTIL